MNKITRLDVVKKSIDLKVFKRRQALESDTNNLITTSTKVYHNGKPVILYYEIDEDLSDLYWALSTIKFNTTKRTAGLSTFSRTFGYLPRLTLKRDFCTNSALAMSNPKQNKIITNFGAYLADLYKHEFPEVYEFHAKTTKDNVLEQWIIPDTPFTSGIINKTTALHYDAGNFKDVFSNMVVLKNGIKGGYLSCPEFDIKFELKNNSVIFFDGQKILHGVTPIHKVHPQGYRYSVVYYSLKAMWNCLPIADEVNRIRDRKLAREIKRADKPMLGDSNEKI